MTHGSLPRTYNTEDDELKKLIAEAKARYEALSPEEKEAHDEAQCQSWIRGETALGMD